MQINLYKFFEKSANSGNRTSGTGVKERVMKILVIDDMQVHLAAALQTLAGHDVTVCGSHEEAYQLLGTQYASNRKALQEQYEREGMDGYDAYQKAQAETKLPYWDAVLSDLLMPAGSMDQGNKGMEYVGKEMAVGWSLALLAARMGAKYVAVVTDMNHHNHPASAMLDAFNRHIFSIDGAKVLMTNSVQKVGITGTECQCEKCHGTGQQSREDGSKYNCYYCKGGVDYSQKGKDWGEILKQLINGLVEN